MYEAALWGAKGWLEPMTDLPATYAIEDVFPSVRDGLSVNGTLYALPFYAEGGWVGVGGAPARSGSS